MKNCEYYYKTMRNISGPGELSRYEDTPTCAPTEDICKFAGDCTNCDIKDTIHVKRYAKPHKEIWYTVAKYGGYDDSPGIDWKIDADKALLSEKDTKHALLKDFDSPFTIDVDLYR